MTQITSAAFVGANGRNEYFQQPDTSTEFVYIQAGDGNDIITSYLATTYTTYGGLGVDFILAGDHNDSLYGDNSSDDETTNANQALAAAADVLLGFGGADTIHGGGGNNFVGAGSGNDLVFGGSGNEMLGGGANNDRIYGEGGNDRLFGGSGTETEVKAFLNANIGTIVTNFNGVNNDPQPGSVDSESFSSAALALTSTGSDYLDGGAGNDMIDGGDGTDTMIGGAGNDTFHVNTGLDKVIEETGGGTLDTVFASSSYRLAEGVAVEALRAAAGTGASILTGNALGQLISGATGSDILCGREGLDDLYGKAGNDAFTFNTSLGSANIDRIYDFANVSGDNDFFQLENTVFTNLQAANGALVAAKFVANAGGQATATNQRILYDTSTGKLFYDADGSGTASTAQQFALLTNKAALTAADFVVI